MGSSEPSDSKGHSHDIAMLPGQGHKLTTTCLNKALEF
jgi:hypothetical protein